MMEEHKPHEEHSAHSEAPKHEHHAGGMKMGDEMKPPKIDMKDLNVGNAFQNFVGILKLDKKVIEEVAMNEKGGAAAALFLLVGVIAAPLVSALIGVKVLGVTVRPDIVSSLVQVVFALIIAILSIFITTMVATRVFKGHGTFAQLFRVMGLASGLSVLNVIGVLLFSLSPLVALVVGLWSLAIGYMAIKAVFKLDDTNAVLTIVVTAVAYFILGAVVAALGFAGASSSVNLSGFSLS